MSDWEPETTPSFSPSEMACKCGKCEGHASMRQDFMRKLQVLREVVNRPLTVTSGYRCPEHPEEKRKDKIGSHGQGRAADIKVSSAKERHEILQAATGLEFVGIGVANSFIHLDNGHDHADRPAAWKY